MQTAQEMVGVVFFAASAQLQVCCRCFLQAVGPSTVVPQVSPRSGTEQGQSSAAWEAKVQHSISTFRLNDTQGLPPDSSQALQHSVHKHRQLSVLTTYPCDDVYQK